MLTVAATPHYQFSEAEKTVQIFGMVNNEKLKNILLDTKKNDKKIVLLMFPLHLDRMQESKQHIGRNHGRRSRQILGGAKDFCLNFPNLARQVFVQLFLTNFLPQRS